MARANGRSRANSPTTRASNAPERSRRVEPWASGPSPLFKHARIITPEAAVGFRYRRAGAAMRKIYSAAPAKAEWAELAAIGITDPGHRPPDSICDPLFRDPALAAGDRVRHIGHQRSCGRVAEGGGLLNRYRVVKPYRGFESLRLRHHPVANSDHRSLSAGFLPSFKGVCENCPNLGDWRSAEFRSLSGFRL